MERKTILFYDVCKGCMGYGVDIILSNPEDEDNYNVYCFKCIPDGIFKIDMLDRCSSIGCSNSVSVKINDDNYCFEDFLNGYSGKRFNIDLSDDKN